MHCSRWLVVSLSAWVLAIGPAAARDEWDTCNNYREQAKAIAACTRLINEGTYKPMIDVYCARGIAYAWSHKYDLAIANFNAGLRLDPKDSICYGQRGIAYRFKGNDTQAMADFETAIALDPSNSTAVSQLEALLRGEKLTPR